jgi:VWFA-related protein
MHFPSAAMIGALCAAIVPLNAQQPAVSTQAAPPASPSAATITVNAQLVNLPVIVRDKNGALVQNLTKDDFALSVDGHPQTIRYFDKDNDLPLTLGLLVDASGSVRSALEDERTASEAFLDQMMRDSSTAGPGSRAPDEAFLIQFAHETDLLQDLTPSRPKLRAALNQVGTEDRDDSQNNQGGGSGGGGGYGHHRGGGFHGGGTTFYDAVFLASGQVMQKQHGRKALVVLTDGEDRGSMETLQSAIASAQRAETVVYAIYFKGEQHGYGGHGGGFGGRGGYPGGGRGGQESHVDGKKVLAQMTAETGGRMFEVSGKQTFAAIYTQIAEELRSQYRLGYTPDAASSAEGYHRVDLTLTKEKKLIVQTRDGYYGGRRHEALFGIA